MLRLLLVPLPLSWLLVLWAGCSAAAANDGLAEKIHAEIAQPHYRHAHWGLLFVDLKSGETVYSHNPDKLFAPASVTKLFSTAAALDALGAEHRFRTPLFARGELAEGVLKGDLILRASGDLTLGGRTTPAGEIAFTSSDHTYANWSGDAVLTEPDPLAGLRDLARQAHAAGLKKIVGDVLIDTRLFEPAEGTGSGPSRVTPIQVNDNLLDFTIKPTKPGEPAQVSCRPENKLFRIESRIETIPEGGKVETWIRDQGDGLITLTGKVPAGMAPIVRIFEIPDPAGWARALLIEQLQAAGVEVAAGLKVQHPTAALPVSDDYGRLQQLAVLESPPFAENARLILKVSHNLHASTLPLLVAVKHGKRTLADGLHLERDFLKRVGVETEAISFGGGAGGARGDYVTPAATVQLLKAMAARPDFAHYERSLPLLGVDGTLAKTVAENSPVRGKVAAKTGTLIWENTLNNGALLSSKALAGYLTTASGRKLAFAAFVNGVHLRDGVDSKRVGSDLGKICELVHTGLSSP